MYVGVGPGHMYNYYLKSIQLKNIVYLTMTFFPMYVKFKITYEYVIEKKYKKKTLSFFYRKVVIRRVCESCGSALRLAQTFRRVPTHMCTRTYSSNEVGRVLVYYQSNPNSAVGFASQWWYLNTGQITLSMNSMSAVRVGSTILVSDKRGVYSCSKVLISKTREFALSAQSKRASGAWKSLRNSFERSRRNG